MQELSGTGRGFLVSVVMLSGHFQTSGLRMVKSTETLENEGFFLLQCPCQGEKYKKQKGRDLIKLENGVNYLFH